MTLTSPELLRQLVARVERLEQEKTTLMADIRDVYSEVKSAGFDVKIVKKIVQIRKQNPANRAEEEELLVLYQHALGMPS